MLYTLFYKLLFLRTHRITFLISAYRPWFSHRLLSILCCGRAYMYNQLPRVDTGGLHIAQDHSCVSVSAYSHHLGLSSEKRLLAVRVCMSSRLCSQEGRAGGCPFRQPVWWENKVGL